MTMEKALPEGWVEAPIGELCQLFNGRAFKKTEWSKTGLPIIRIQNLNNPNATFNHFNGDLDNKHFVRNGDLLFAWSGTPGTSFGAHEWPGGDAALNQHIFKISFSEREIYKPFFKYAINQKLDELIGSANGGVGLRHVTKGSFEKTRIFFPPFAEQQVIADALDALLAQVETTKTRLERVPETIKRFRQSVLAAAVSGKLTECDVKNWQPTNIGQLAELVTSGSRGWAKFYSDSGSIFIRSQDINSDDLDISEPCYVSLPEKVEGARTSVRRNDLLITITGANVTKCARIKNEITDAYVSQHVALIRLDNAENAPFIELALKSLEAGRKQLTDMAYGGGKPGLNLQNIKDVHFRIPPLPEQQEIVRRVEELFAHADAVEQQAKAALEKVNNLTQSILAKAFRGELTADWRVANPELISGENSAEALLARIKEERAAQKPKKRGTRKRTS